MTWRIPQLGGSIKGTKDTNTPRPMIITPVTLEGSIVRLEPLSSNHLDILRAVAFDERIWQWTSTAVKTDEDLKAYIETALKWEREGTALSFLIIEKKSERGIGSTRFANVDTANRRLEIGWTWIAPPWQQTAVNTEAKYLLLRHAFETLGCIRVEFKTDALNTKSRAALLRIGAKEEGLFRNHMIMATGRIRNSVYFSIIDSEWPGIKAKLRTMLERK